MNQTSLLSALRRRWWIIVLFALAGATAGAIPEPEQVEEIERSFVATHTLLLNDTDEQSGSTVISPSQVTLFVTTGEVPQRVADELGSSGNPATLASQVESVFDFGTGALTITGRGDDGSRVEEVVDTFADTLVSYLAERQDVIYQERLAASLQRLADVELQLTDITSELARDPDDPILLAQQSAIARQYSVAFEQNEQLAVSPPVIGFTTLQRAQAVETTDTGLGAPRSRTTRAALGGIVGAALGIGIALLLGVLDRRIRSKEQAEEAVGLRAQVTIPKSPAKDRDQIIVRPDRHDTLSDSYRTVRTVVAFAHSNRDPELPAPITLVVSPSAGDGKTSLAANLAAASAASGQRTVLINADFRRPRLASVFGSDAEAPLPFMFEDIEKLNGPTLLNRTGIERLRLFDLSRVHAPASELSLATIEKLPDLRAMCDHVIIDTSPIGATAEVLDLVPHADAIVMTVRVGNSTVAQAQRASALIRDLTTVPTILVVGGVKGESSPYDEYTDRRHEPADEKPRRGFRRNRERPGAALPPPSNSDDPTDEHQLPLDITVGE